MLPAFRSPIIAIEREKEQIFQMSVAVFYVVTSPVYLGFLLLVRDSQLYVLIFFFFFSQKKAHFGQEEQSFDFA